MIQRRYLMYKYTYFCKKCCHTKECDTKQDWGLEKTDHKMRGCQLMTAPDKDREILTRPQLALEARKGKEMVEEAISRKKKDEDQNPASE